MPQVPSNIQLVCLCLNSLLVAGFVPGTIYCTSASVVLRVVVASGTPSFWRYAGACSSWNFSQVSCRSSHNHVQCGHDTHDFPNLVEGKGRGNADGQCMASTSTVYSQSLACSPNITMTQAICVFTGCIFLANAAYVQATVMWVTLTPLIYRFARFCDKRYGAAVRRMPLELAAQAPSATVNPIVYTPPALRCVWAYFL